MRYVVTTDAPSYVVENSASMVSAEMGLFLEGSGKRMYAVDTSGRKVISIRKRGEKIIISDRAEAVRSVVVNILFSLVFILGPLLGALGLAYQAIVTIIAIIGLILYVLRAYGGKRGKTGEFAMRLAKDIRIHGYAVAVEERR